MRVVLTCGSGLTVSRLPTPLGSTQPSPGSLVGAEISQTSRRRQQFQAAGPANGCRALDRAAETPGPSAARLLRRTNQAATAGSSRTSMCRWSSITENPATEIEKISASSCSRLSIQTRRSFSLPRQSRMPAERSG